MKPISLLFSFVLFIIFTSSSTAQIKWTKYPDNPVLLTPAAGNWDEGLIAFPTVLFDGEMYHMWYSGYNDNPSCIGYATSADGISWTKYDDPTTIDPPYDESDPVLFPGLLGTYDDEAVASPSVILVDDLYHMWYAGDGEPSDPGHSEICHATSSDGIMWTKDTLNPVVNRGVNGTWDDYWLFEPCVVFDGEIYHMWYCAWHGNWPPDRVRIGHATAPHPDSSWTKDPNNPVLDMGSSNLWDYDRVDAPSVVFDGTRFHMFYSGGSYIEWQIGYATSEDGSLWEKYIDNPVLSYGNTGDYDATNVSHCSVIRDTINNQYKMWYIGAQSDESGHIGYATAPDILDVPGDFATIQAAIDEATDGDLVLVDEGTYYENINFKGKAITVASHFYVDEDTSHISKTIIDGSQPEDPDAASVVYFGSGEDSNSVLCGFTIKGGTGTINNYNGYNSNDGGGISIFYSGAKIINNIVKKNVLKNASVDNFGAGIAAVGGSKDHIIIRDNVFKDNEIHFESLSGSGWGAGAGLGTEGTLLFEKNIVEHNKIEAIAHSVGGGIVVDGNFGLDGYTTINSNIITNNEANHRMNLSDMNQRGGGVAVNYANVILTNNIITNNFSQGYGGGVHINSYSSTIGWSRTRMINNTIVRNKADVDGGIYIRGAYVYPLIINSIVWDNSSDHGNQISGNSDHLEVVYSDIQGNWTGEGNIDLDPLFEDTISYKLSNRSPCVGNGIDSIEISGTYYHCPDLCYGGTPRPNLVDEYVDMGAIESPYRQVSLAIDEEELLLPQAFNLIQNYPNPFNPTTKINYELPIANYVDLSIYNLLGQKMVALVDEKQNAGYHQVEWDASGFASGVYYYRIEAGKFVDVKKMILLR
jgi:predicted GH43/DUF377 family glycosyl hydrolase